MDDLKCQNDSQINNIENNSKDNNELSQLTQSQIIVVENRNDKENENSAENPTKNVCFKANEGDNKLKIPSSLPANNTRLVDSVRSLFTPISILNNNTASTSSSIASDKINSLLKPMQFSFASASLPKKSAPILIDLIKSSNSEVEKTINANMDIVYEQMKSNNKLSSDDNSNNVLKLLYTITPGMLLFRRLF